MMQKKEREAALSKLIKMIETPPDEPGSLPLRGTQS